MPKPLGKLGSLCREDGTWLTAYRLSGTVLRRFRNTLIARRLGAPGLHIGRSPRVAGLAHMHLGHGITAGDSFWLEAVTRFAGTEFNPSLIIGNRCSFSDRVHIACVTAVTLGDDVLCGSNVIITDHAHGTYSGPAPHSPPEIPPNIRTLSAGRTVTIGARVWIGDNVAVLPGAHIGEGSVIGANSVVTGVIPPGIVALGAPARPVRQWDPASAAWVPIDRT